MELKDFYARRKDLQNQVKEVVESAHDLKEPDLEDSQYMGILETNLRLMAAKVEAIREEYVGLLTEQFCEEEPEEEEQPQQVVEPEVAPAVPQPQDMVGAIISGLGAFASAWTMYQQQRKR